jgi:hypothetical protein
MMEDQRMSRWFQRGWWWVCCWWGCLVWGLRPTSAVLVGLRPKPYVLFDSDMTSM